MTLIETRYHVSAIMLSSSKKHFYSIIVKIFLFSFCTIIVIFHVLHATLFVLFLSKISKSYAWCLCLFQITICLLCCFLFVLLWILFQNWLRRSFFDNQHRTKQTVVRQLLFLNKLLHSRAFFFCNGTITFHWMHNNLK